MKREEFLNLPVEEIRELIQEKGGMVSVCPINGTRRWYQLEYPPDDSIADPIWDYIEVSARAHIDLCKLFFNLGLETLVTPIFDSVMLGRNAEYARLAADGLMHMVEGEEFNRFYDEYDVRVRFYGHYEDCFRGTLLEPLGDKFAELTERTRHHNSYRLFFGICSAEEASIIITETVKFYEAFGRQPTQEELIARFYGEAVKPADIFIGFGKFSIFSIPLLSAGDEDYYFTVSPSLYLTEEQLRDIVYDRLFGRRGDNVSYGTMSPEDQRLMRRFYHMNIGNTLGVGDKQVHGHYWYPLPQVVFPEEF